MSNYDTTPLESDRLNSATPVAPMQLRVIPEGESFSAHEEVSEDIVKAVFAVRRTKNDPRYEKSVTFDFSGVSREQLIQLALYDVKVWAQRVLRAISVAEMLQPETLSKVDVLHDIVNGSRRPTDPVGAAFRTLARQFGITEEAAREAFHVAAAPQGESD